MIHDIPITMISRNAFIDHPGVWYFTSNPGISVGDTVKFVQAGEVFVIGEVTEVHRPDGSTPDWTFKRPSSLHSIRFKEIKHDSQVSGR